MKDVPYTMKEREKNTFLFLFPLTLKLRVTFSSVLEIVGGLKGVSYVRVPFRVPASAFFTPYLENTVSKERKNSRVLSSHHNCNEMRISTFLPTKYFPVFITILGKAGARGSVVFKALSYKLEGRGIASR
jgi:hypothetical protein